MLRLLPPPTDVHDAYDSKMRLIDQNLIACAYEVLWLNLAKLQNTPQLTPSSNLLLVQSRSRHNLHNMFI